MMQAEAIHQPCDDCGSSDALTINHDGSTKCFACGRFRANGNVHHITEAKKKVKDFGSVQAAIITGEPPDLTSRCIASSTAKKFGVVGVGSDILFPYYKEGDKAPIACKRRLQGKRFLTEGRWREGALFGQNLFAAGGNAITVVEGEFDALAAYQINGGYPVVSVRNGAQSAVKDCQEQYEYLNSFDKIVLCLDNDEHGQKATQQIADLFGAKAHIFPHVESLKDANDYLTAGKAKEWMRSWWNSTPYTPDGIVMLDDLLDSITKPIPRSPVRYPFAKLDSMLLGLREAELVTLCSGSGLGKSTILREIASSLLSQVNEPVGLMFLEETPERTARGLIGLHLNKPIHLPEVEYDGDEVIEVYNKLNLKNRVALWDSFGSNSIERVTARMRYFVKALGCKHIILDHLSILVSDQSVDDERKALDMIMTKLRMFAQEMRVTLILVSHLTRPPGKSLEDGAATSLGMLRGSGSIAQLSDAVIGAERNSQAEDAEERNTTKLRVLKNRICGITGPAGELIYDHATGRLTEKKYEEAL